MIPAPRCISGRELTEARLSPDGSMVACVSRGAGGAAVMLVPVSGGPERQLTADPAPRPGRGLGGGCFDWMPDGSGVVYVGADGNLWLQRIAAVAAEQLTRLDPARGAQAPSVAPDGRTVAAVVDLAEVVLVDLVDSGQASVDDLRRVDGGDHDFVIDPIWSADGTTLAWQAWSVPSMPWDESVLVVLDVMSGARRTDGARPERVRPVQRQQPRFDPAGGLWCLADTDGWLNLACDGVVVHQEQSEHGGPTWGPGQRSFVVSPDGAHVAFTRNEAGFGRLCILDRATNGVTPAARGVHGSLSWVGEHLVALRSGARTPTQIVSYRVDLPARTFERTSLAVGPLAGWEHEDLVEPEPVVHRSRDGTTLHARLYRTPGASGLICWVHGGPTDQWQVTFLPRLAHWQSRGYSILVPDHRGSTGHGREYQQALRGRWGELDVADVADAIQHAHEQGWGIPATTALMGSSAGGFTCLGVVATAPELLGTCVVLYPVADLFDLSERSHRFERHYNDTLVGSPTTDADRYRQRSPLSFADRLTAVPLLVMHGSEDPVVPVDQSRALVSAIEQAGGQVQYQEYEGEGHGFRQPANQLDEYERVADFLAAHLQPRQ